jgi:hypothetical protein
LLSQNRKSIFLKRNRSSLSKYLINFNEAFNNFFNNPAGGGYAAC